MENLSKVSTLKDRIKTDVIKAGLFKTDIEDEFVKYSYYCNCGNNTDVQRLPARVIRDTNQAGKEHICSKCKNKYFMPENANPAKTIIMGAYILNKLELVDIDISRINISAKVKNDSFSILRVNMERRYQISFRDNSIKVYKNGDPEVYLSLKDDDKSVILYDYETQREYGQRSVVGKKVLTRVLKFLFSGVKIEESLNRYSTKNIYSFKGIVARASNLRDYPEEDIKMYLAIQGELERNFLRKYQTAMPSLIAYLSMVFKENNIDVIYLLERMYKSDIDIKDSTYTKSIGYEDFYGTSVFHLFSFVDDRVVWSRNMKKAYEEAKSKRKLHQRLALPKPIFDAMRNSKDEYIYTAENIGDIHRVLYEQDLETPMDKKTSIILELLTEGLSLGLIESVLRDISKLSELKISYNHDVKRLLEYIYTECPMYQGITSSNRALGLLSDYINMSIDLGYEYEKYPRSLVRAHDVKMINHRLLANETTDEKFIEAIRQYSDLIYINKGYKMIVPSVKKDLVNEGAQLHHCISSYYNSIKEGRSLIFFMRDLKEIDKPLVTVELNSSYRLVQARGSHNRMVNREESIFIQLWMEFVKETLKNRRQVTYNEEAKFE